MFRTYQLIYMLTLGILWSTSYALAQMKVKTLTWELLLDLSVKADPAVRAAHASLLVAQGELSRAKENPNPMSLTASTGPRVDISGKLNAELSIGLGHTFELGDKVKLRSQVAKARIAKLNAAVAEARRAAVFRVALPWSRLVGTHALQIARRRQLSLAERLVNETRRRVMGGVGTKAELHVASLMHIEVKGALSRTQAEGKAWAELLRVQLNLSSTPKVSANQVRLSVPRLKNLLDNLPTRWAEAIRLSAAVDEAKATAHLRSAQSQGDLKLGGYIGFEDSQGLLGLNLQIPLPTTDWSTLETSIGMRRAEVIKLKREVVLRRVSERLTQAWWRWDGYRRRADVLKTESEPIITASLATTESLISRGQGTAIELITLLQRVASLERAIIEAELDAREAAVMVLVIGGAL